MSTKKCACFTPSGLVYTRLETDGNIARRPIDHQNKENATRVRRFTDNEVFEEDADTVESILRDNPSIGHLGSENEYINETMNNVMCEKIDELIKETEAFLAAKKSKHRKRTKRRAQNWAHSKQKQKI
ncbi:hypothetical protein EVAR_95384_1 [Eumeta japonica]|uniref:Uncharacterized protein n=1 Tax=Eumeta variegata TaxID=151549 RepID=A0A4C2A0R3_EUMVA|nr:hypothetical protein EVAR_95384_1 [Eumeta japonica]